MLLQKNARSHVNRKPKNNMALVALAVANVAATSFLPARAFGQEAQLEEIVVTATKREENQKDVPIAMSVFTADDLHNRSATRLSDVTFAAANVALSQNDELDSSTTITIRGLGTTDNNTGVTPSVGLYIDGVYVGRNIAFDSALSDDARVEKLKGPQGTLFGKNTIQGAINVTTERPRADMGTTLDVMAGDYSLWQGRVSTGGALVDDVLFGKATIYSRDRQGYVFDSGNDTHLNGEHYWGGRTQLLYSPNPALDVLFSFDGQKDDTSANTLSIGGVHYTVATNGLPGGRPEFFQRNIDGTSMEVDYKWAEATFTSVTAFRSLNSHFANDQDYTTQLFNLIAQRLESNKQYSQEFRVASSSTTQLQWLGGLYFYRQDEQTDTYAAFGPAAGPLNGVILDAGPVPLDLKSYAAFGDVTIPLSERWSARLGARYTDEEQNVFFNQTSNISVFNQHYPQSRTDRDPSEDASVSFKWSENTTAYAKFARGFKSGGFNTTLVTTPGQQTSFAPEHLNSYELGLKSVLADNRLQFNAAIFHLDYKNRQESVFVPSDFSFSFQNAAAIKSNGAEVEGDLVAASWARFHIGVGWNHGRYDSFQNCGGLNVNCTGNQLTAPSVDANASAQFEWPVSDRLRFLARVDGLWQNSYYTDVQNTLLADSRTLVNGRLAVREARDRWELALWTNNLTNNAGFAPEKHPFFPNTLVTPIPPPRTYGVEARIRF